MDAGSVSWDTVATTIARLARAAMTRLFARPIPRVC